MKVLGAVALASCLGLVVGAARAEPPRPEQPRAEPWAAVPISVGLVRFSHIGDLNQALAAADRDRLGELMPSVGIALRFGLPRRFFAEPGYRFVVAESEHATFMQHHFLGNVGWTAIAAGDVRLAPVVGVGLAIVTLDVLERATTPESFSVALGSPRGEVLLSTSTLLLHAGVAADVWRSARGDFLGMRAGALLDPLKPQWKRRGAAVVDGPDPPVTGGYFAAAFGFEIPR